MKGKTDKPASEEIEPLVPIDERDISSSDREKILAEIDHTVSQSRTEIKPDTFTYTSKRSGALMPLLVNVAAFLVIFIAASLLVYFFNRQEVSIAKGSARILSAEGKVLEAFKAESEKKLQEKDREILSIQNNLSEARKDRDKLRLETEAKLRQKENELTQAFEQELAAERERLKSGGLSDADVERRLQAIEEERQRKLERELAAVKEQMEANRAAREAVLASVIDQYEQTLRRTREERSDLAKELKQEKSDLEKQLERRERELAGERDRIATELDRIRNARQQEKLILAQLVSLYDRVIEDMQKYEYAKAIGDLDTLQNYISQESIASFTAVKDRRHLEFFLIGSLKKLIGLERALSGYDVRNLIASSKLLGSVNIQAQQGNSSFESGDTETAQQKYRAAIDTIPALKQGYARLREIESQSTDSTRQEILRAIRKGDDLYNAGDFEGSVKMYRVALEGLDVDSQTASGILARIMDAGYHIRAAEERGRMLEEAQSTIEQAEKLEQKRTAQLQRLNRIDEQLKTSRKEAVPSGRESEQRLVSLLEAKVLAKQILDSQSVKSEHPDLYERMEQYFKALGEEQRLEGYDAALTDTTSIIDAVRGLKQEKELESVWDRGKKDMQGETLSLLIERLRALLE
jgi:hypothetical protein